MIESLRPRYPTFLIVGFLIVASALFLLTPGRDAMIAVWTTKLFHGHSSETTFKATQIADAAIGNFTATWLFVGLSVIKLGIGMAIATIVMHLRATREATYDAYSPLKVEGIEEAKFEEPWYGRWFARFLVIGVGVVLFALVLTLWWDANTVLLKKAELQGQTTGGLYHTWVIIDATLGPVITGVKFLGEGLVILGIAGGLATIISHLSFQSRGLAFFTRRAFGQDPGPMADPPQPFFPWRYFGIAIAGATMLALSLPAGMVQAGFGSWAKWKTFDGGFSEHAVNVAGVLDRAIEPAIIMGLGLLFFAIAFLLLTIVRYLREQRRTFGEAVADLSGGAIKRPTIEPMLWPTKTVLPLAVFGLVVVGFFFLGMTAIHAYNFDRVTNLQVEGLTKTVEYQNSLRLDSVLRPVIGAGRFVGIGALMLAIGMALTTIVINLRATGMLLPTGFGKLISKAKGDKVEEEDLSLDRQGALSLAPWDLLRPHLIGEGFIFTAMFPIAIMFSWSIHRLFTERFAGHADPGTMSGLFKSSFVGVNVYSATLRPWILLGMGLILFAIGRFFSTIVGFVEARRLVIDEGVHEIAAAKGTQPAPAISGGGGPGG